MAKSFYYLFKELRPRQWVKNLTVFASIFFTGKLFDINLLTISFYAFLAFCAASSTIYLVNDTVDYEKDRLHPFKKYRPLASGKVGKKAVMITAAILLVISLVLAKAISIPFFLLIVFFLFLHLAYSFFLKNIILIDIMAIALGFILRVFGGEVATGYHLDVWLFLSVISVALFLAIGKRRSELTLISGWDGGTISAKTRATLSHYSEKMLDVYISMFANSAWITYAFYTFLRQTPRLRQSVSLIFEQSDLSFLADRKFFMLTIPIVIYIVMRYLQLIYEKNEGESPEKVLTSDVPLIVSIMILGVMLFGIIYVIGK